ncbi:hypothetical protein ACFUTV_42635 [Streptomyces sp. NPDC057298]|uniref:hypothetical protein n=1 Tax=Streptomyces sp. NPDC057298 TaxID=3346091 RepID=UPI003625C285
MTGAVFAAVPAAQAASAPATDCRFLVASASPAEMGRFCRNGQSQSDDRDLSENLGGLVGIVLDILID